MSLTCLTLTKGNTSDGQNAAPLGTIYLIHQKGFSTSVLRHIGSTGREIYKPRIN